MQQVRPCGRGRHVIPGGGPAQAIAPQECACLQGRHACMSDNEQGVRLFAGEAWGARNEEQGLRCGGCWLLAGLWARAPQHGICTVE